MFDLVNTLKLDLIYYLLNFFLYTSQQDLALFQQNFILDMITYMITSLFVYTFTWATDNCLIFWLLLIVGRRFVQHFRPASVSQICKGKLDDL